MNASTTPLLSHGIWLLTVLVLGLLTRQAWRRARQAKAQNASRLQQVQAVRDALQVWLMDGTPTDIQELQQAIERTTALRTWWLNGAGPAPMCRCAAPCTPTHCWGLPVPRTCP